MLGIGAVDVRSMASLEKAVEKCVKELGSIDYVMYVFFFFFFDYLISTQRPNPNPTKVPFLSSFLF